MIAVPAPAKAEQKNSANDAPTFQPRFRSPTRCLCADLSSPPCVRVRGKPGKRRAYRPPGRALGLLSRPVVDASVACYNIRRWPFQRSRRFEGTSALFESRLCGCVLG